MVTIDTHSAGLARAQRYGLSVDDGLVAAAALEAGCATLWSEDMHHGLVIDERLKILNPFIGGDPCFALTGLYILLVPKWIYDECRRAADEHSCVPPSLDWVY